MSKRDSVFAYTAIASTGQRIKGEIRATSSENAFALIKGSGLSPLKVAKRSSERPIFLAPTAYLSDADLAAVLRDLAVLTGSGVEFKNAVNLEARTADSAAARRASTSIERSVSEGVKVSEAFRPHLKSSQRFVAALLEAGELVGDLAGGLARSSDVLASRSTLRAQLLGTLAYPGFILASSVASLLLILLFVIPNLEPLIAAQGMEGSAFLTNLMGLSRLLRDHPASIAAGLAIAVVASFALKMSGALSWVWEQAAFVGPGRKIANGLVLGRFAHTLGRLIAGGAPVDEALRVCLTLVQSKVVSGRLSLALEKLRQGESVSSALAGVEGMPKAVVRLVSVGEASGRLGAMLAQAGEMEEAAALRTLDRYAKLLGPVMIVLLGGLVGGLMASLLSSITSIGQQSV